MSWIILAGILIDILSPSQGIVNQVIKLFGFKPVFFLGNEKWFPYVMVITDLWKNFGFETIIYLAALTSIDPTQYESAIVDGAGKWRQAIHMNTPGHYTYNYPHDYIKSRKYIELPASTRFSTF